MSQPLDVPGWLRDIDPDQLGFPLPVDSSRYHKDDDILYKQTPAGPLLLDAYRPADAGRCPLVVMIHGGGWARGGRSEMGLSKWAGYLASGGLSVVSIDYRLAPETSYPDSFQDCLDAVDWAVEHAADLGADAARIGLWGDSAGGHLALLIATSQTNPSFSGPRMRSDSAHLRAAATFYAPTNLLRLHRSVHRDDGWGSTVRDFVGIDPELDPQRWREASPSEHVHPQVPPLLLLHGKRDMYVPYKGTVAFAERLAAAGAPYELHLVEHGLHGFDRIAPGEEGKALIARTREFLCEYLSEQERRAAGELI